GAAHYLASWEFAKLVQPWLTQGYTMASNYSGFGVHSFFKKW
ncbi:MAG: hypothetical protein ACJAZF_003396, partial [Granulosicoccus sp.]